MTERCFDSLAADSLRVHRMPYQDHCGAIHAIGNGDIMLYGRGPEWMQVFGAPYSCPTILSLVVPEGEALRSHSHRREKAGSWTHILEQGEMTDCASRAHRCIARHWNLTSPVRFELDCHDFPLTDQSALFPGDAWLVSVPANAAVYNDYPLVREAFMMLAVQGGCRAERTETGLLLTFSGEGTLYVAGAQTYPECLTQLQSAYRVPFEELLAAADLDDRAFLEACARNRAPLKDHPLRDAVLAAAESAALMIRAQQHSGGGVQAGHNYHLAYVRDQYGVSRGLIALGALKEAAAILDFYRRVFERHGFIANAQAMGVDGVFHVHENDLVELTGYLLLQACDLLEAAGDREFFRSLQPLLSWALRSQLSCLHNGMLPFNGDETYVAGGLVPRTMLNHGSFEATLLLLTGGRRYIGHYRALEAMEPWMDAALRTLDSVSAQFDHNFRRESGYVANSLLRVHNLAEPGFRHGVCCSDGFFGWLRREGEGIYLCPRCAGRASVEPCREEYHLKSTLLMAPFVCAEQIDPACRAAHAAGFLAGYRETGMLPSLPAGTRCLGYDFGLLLFAAADAGLNADDLLAHMLSLQDPCGAWSEYYDGRTPAQTRCRPWESAINIAGALRYLS